jgi:acetoin utilization protein AcuB
MSLLVKDMMTRNPITIGSDALLATAVAVMKEKGIRHLPVIDAQDRLSGVITDRDIRSMVFAVALAEFMSCEVPGRLPGPGPALDGPRVREAMTWGAVTTTPETPIAQAAAVMFERRLGSLPVVEDGKLVGIVTERDMLRTLSTFLPSAKRLDPDLFP